MNLVCFDCDSTLSAVEGMASGLAVLSNLDDETHTRLFRRYSFLNECPILSTTPGTLTSTEKDNVSTDESQSATHANLQGRLG